MNFKIRLIIGFVSVVVIGMTIGIYKVKYTRLETRLNETEQELNSTRNSLAQSRAECTILKEDSKRVQTAMEQYTHTIQSQQAEYVEKFNVIQEDRTATDWLNTPLPNSIRLFYDCSCDGD